MKEIKRERKTEPTFQPREREKQWTRVREKDPDFYKAKLTIMT